MIMRNVLRFMMLGVLSATGCVSLGRDSPQLEQYVLGSGRSPTTAAASDDAAGMAIGIRRIDLAAYLATPSIVVRRGANQIIVSDFHRWAEDVGAGINREFAHHLRAAAGVGRVDIAPWPVRAQHDYLVQLHVTRFEGMADSLASEGSAHVAATWDIIRPVDGGVVARGSTDHQRSGWRVHDYAALVVMLEVGLDELAGDVLACLMHVRSAVATRAAENNGQQAITCGGRDGDV
jgi:uncharacterized lipoprotein YmbA